VIIFLTAHQGCCGIDTCEIHDIFTKWRIFESVFQVGDTTLTKWLDKGLIGCESDKKGIRTNIRYSALELAHVGVLAQLSTWGVLNYYGLPH